jgi:hypothetical protein
METVLSKLQGDEFFTLVLMLSAMLVGLIITVTAVIVINWRRVRQLDLEHSLKHDMLQRGWSAEAIERVIRATATPPEGENKEKASESFGDAAASRAGLMSLTDKQLHAKVASDLAAYEMDREMMEDALQALGHADLETKQAVAQAVMNMTENGVEHEQLLAAIVNLCDAPREHCPKL